MARERGDWTLREGLWVPRDARLTGKNDYRRNTLGFDVACDGRKPADAPHSPDSAVEPSKGTEP